MSVINLTPVHYMGLIYLAFAHLTDGIFDKDEQTIIWKSLKKWMPENSNHIDFSKIMDEIIQWYKQLQLEEEFESNLEEIIIKINEYDWFTDDKKEDSLKDLRNIALADKQFLETEKKWIRYIAKLWDVEKKVIRRIVK